MAWTTKRQPFGPNRSPLLAGLASDGSGAVIPVAVDPSTGAVIINDSGSASSALYTGQQTVNTTQVQLSSGNHSLSNGILIKALSSNSAAVYIGLTGVTSTTGDALEPGETRGYAVNNTNLLYIISVASTTDKVTFSAN